MSRERYIVASVHEPAAPGEYAFYELSVVDTATARPWRDAREATGDFLEFEARGGAVFVMHGAARFLSFYPKHDTWYLGEATRDATARLVPSRAGRPRLVPDSGDPGYARRLPAAFEGAVERFAEDTAAQRALGKRATALLLAWLERRAP